MCDFSETWLKLTESLQLHMYICIITNEWTDYPSISNQIQFINIISNWLINLIQLHIQLPVVI